VEIAGLDGESHFLTQLAAFFLERSGSSQGGVEGQIAGFSFYPAGLDVAAALALGARL
jgi:hypothetical protein